MMTSWHDVIYLNKVLDCGRILHYPTGSRGARISSTSHGVFASEFYPQLYSYYLYYEINKQGTPHVPLPAQFAEVK